jgi:EF hand
MQEFKLGLKRLRIRDLKMWNVRMVRRLFEELDANRDGTISIKEFTAFVQGNVTLGGLGGDGVGGRRGGAGDKASGGGARGSLLSDDEDDDVFSKRKAISDNELFRKVRASYERHDS